MAKEYQTNSMPLYNGMSPGLNAYGQVPNLAWTPRIVAKTAAYTVPASESGTIFTTAGATAAVTFTLPAITDGPFVFDFIAVADVAMTVAAATADTLCTFNDAAADSVAFSTTSEIIGGWVKVVCDGTTIIALTPISSETQTVTVATN